MHVLKLDLGERSYPIYIGEGGLGDAALFAPHIRGHKVMIVTNTTVGPLYESSLRQALKDYEVDSVVLPDGEEHKNWQTLNLIFDALLQGRHSRHTTIIALGGGVVGDMAGFAASCYQRGVDFIQVPTTLLSQVDSSVGGKTAINHPLGKNMIGAFHQPKAVVIDTLTLKTLAHRELAAGLAEVIKYGLIRDAEFFHWLEQNTAAILALEPEALNYAIRTSCACKAGVVEEDETEGGVRAILNLGHTFGHAIETHAGYGRWLHGEAVAAGTVMAAQLSCKQGWINDLAVERIHSIFKACGLPVSGPADMHKEDYLQRMAVDKKVLDGNLRLVLLTEIGRAVVSSNFDVDYLNAVLQA